MNSQILLDKSPICFTQVDPKGRIIFANPAWSDFTGYSVEELQSKTFLDITHPEDIEKGHFEFEFLKKGEITQYRLQKRYIHKSGRIIWGDLFVSLAPEETRSNAHLAVSTVVDITAKKEQEAALKEEEDNFRFMFMNNPQPMGIYSVKTLEFLELNQAACNLYGYTREELLKMKGTDLASPEQRSKVKDFISLNNSSYNSGQIWKLTTKSGEKKLVEITSHGIIYKGIPARHYMLIDVTEREKAFFALQENEAFISQAEEIAHMGSWEWDVVNNCYFKRSYNYFKLFKMDPLAGEPSSEKFLKMVHPDDRDAVIKAFECILKDKQPYKLEFRVELPDNRIRWIQDKVEPVFNKKGELVRLKGASIDVTERKENEIALIENRNSLRQAQILAKMGSWQYDPIKNKFFLSDNLFDLFKVDQMHSNISFDFFKSLVHPDDLEIFMSAFSGLSEGCKKRILEYRIILHDETTLWIESHSEPVFENNLLVQVRGVCIDITERKEQGKDLLNFSKVVEQSSAMIMVTDIEGRIEYVNPKFTQLSGYQMREIVGQNPRILKSHKMNPQIYADLWTTIRSGKEWKGQLINKSKSGTYFWVQKTISPVVDEKGMVINYVSIGENITEKKKVEKELIAAKEKAEESDRLKTAFLQNISHEIRTPMNGILGFMYLLKEPDLASEERNEFIEIVNQSGARLLNTVNEIIEISKIESGSMDIKIALTDTHELINQIKEFFKLKAEEKGVVLQLGNRSLMGEDAFILTDKTKLESILTNLVNNALKFTNEGSIEIGNYREEDMLIFYVKDTGTGIPKEKIDFIFDRFSQASEGLARVKEGVGLGLSIARAYVEALQGKIWAYSEEEKGSTFFFSIPYRSEKRENSFNEADCITKATHTILIAEDDKITFWYYKKLLTRRGIRVLKAKDGGEALRLVKDRTDIALILMDLKMPVMNGLEVTRQIRQFNKTIPIIAQTAYGFLRDRNEAIEAGCNDYISKPADPLKLIHKINKHLERAEV